MLMTVIVIRATCNRRGVTVTEKWFYDYARKPSFILHRLSSVECQDVRRKSED